MREASVIGRKLEGVMERSGLLSKDGARRSPPASYLNKYEMNNYLIYVYMR